MSSSSSSHINIFLCRYLSICLNLIKSYNSFHVVWHRFNFMALLQEAGESLCSTVLLLLGITRHHSIFIQVDHLVIEVIAAAPVIVAPAIRVAVI